MICSTCGKPINDEWFYASRNGEKSHLVCLPKGDSVPDAGTLPDRHPSSDDTKTDRCGDGFTNVRGVLYVCGQKEGHPGMHVGYPVEGRSPMNDDVTTWPASPDVEEVTSRVQLCTYLDHITCKLCGERIKTGQKFQGQAPSWSHYDLGDCGASPVTGTVTWPDDADKSNQATPYPGDVGAAPGDPQGQALTAPSEPDTSGTSGSGHGSPEVASDYPGEDGCALRWGGGYKVCQDGHRCGYCENGGRRHICKCGASLHGTWIEPSTPSAGTEPAHAFLGQQVRVLIGTAGPNGRTVVKGKLLSFSNGGEFTVQDEDGFVHYCWPLLDIEAATPSNSTAQGGSS